MNRYPSMDQPRGYKCSDGKKKINDGHMLYSIRSVRKAAQLESIYVHETRLHRNGSETKSNRANPTWCARFLHHVISKYSNRGRKKKKKKMREKSREICLPNVRAIDSSREFLSREILNLNLDNESCKVLVRNTWLYCIVSSIQ